MYYYVFNIDLFFQQEQNRLSREREQRIQAEAERDKYKNEIAAINEQLRNMKVLKKNIYNYFLFPF